MNAAPMIDCPACGKEIQHHDCYDVDVDSEYECACGANLVCTMVEHIKEWEWALANPRLSTEDEALRVRELEAALGRVINCARHYAQGKRQQTHYAFHMLTLRECEDVLHRRPHLSTEDEVRGIVDGKLVKMREYK